MNETNLLEETLEFLEQNGKSPKDVLYIINNSSKFSWEGFCKISNIKYDSGYGLNEVRMDLMVLGVDWWLERDEYDGAEGWKFKQLPSSTNLEFINECDISENDIMDNANRSLIRQFK